MSLFELFVLAVGLCMDSFAVSLTSGVLLKPFTLSRVLKIAAFMAVFQGAMPLIGWFLGIGFKNYIEAYDHWVAFGVLLFLKAGPGKESPNPVALILPIRARW